MWFKNPDVTFSKYGRANREWKTDANRCRPFKKKHVDFRRRGIGELDFYSRVD